MKVILAAGAPVNEINDISETALHIAAEEDDRAEIVELLLKTGADIDAKRIFDETALDVAESNGSKNVASMLRKATKPGLT